MVASWLRLLADRVDGVAARPTLKRMDTNRSVNFFDEQFRRQVAAGEYALNPFELAALPHLHGAVLDYGCGLGNLAVEAARRGCQVLALDASARAAANAAALRFAA